MQSHRIPSSLRDTYKGLTEIPKLFLQEAAPHQMKTTDLKNIDPRLVGTRKLMTLTPDYLTMC